MGHGVALETLLGFAAHRPFGTPQAADLGRSSAVLGPPPLRAGWSGAARPPVAQVARTREDHANPDHYDQRDKQRVTRVDE